jgi:L-aminopeptidase/D-esterase-like protein
MPDGLIVAALVAVNALGDVIDPATGKVIAGVRTPDGAGLADARVLLRSGQMARPALPATPRAAVARPDEGGGARHAAAAEAAEEDVFASGGNTTLGVIATNATLTKAQAKKVAQMAHDGYARAIVPIHTLADGDTIFTLATGERRGDANLNQIGALAAEVMADAIVRAARQATSVAGIPAIRDLSSAAALPRR